MHASGQEVQWRRNDEVGLVSRGGMWSVDAWARYGKKQLVAGTVRLGAVLIVDKLEGWTAGVYAMTRVEDQMGGGRGEG